MGMHPDAADVDDGSQARRPVNWTAWISLAGLLLIVGAVLFSSATFGWEPPPDYAEPAELWRALQEECPRYEFRVTIDADRRLAVTAETSRLSVANSEEAEELAMQVARFAFERRDLLPGGFVGMDFEMTHMIRLGPFSFSRGSYTVEYSHEWFDAQAELARLKEELRENEELLEAYECEHRELQEELQGRRGDRAAQD